MKWVYSSLNHAMLSSTLYTQSLSVGLVISDSTAIDTVRQSLADASDRWFFWLIASSMVVAVGVALEAPEATIALRKWFALRRGKTPKQDDEKSFVVPAAYLGLLLVIIGVIGEGLFEALASRAETALRAHDELILAQAIGKAGDAKKSAEEAAAAAAHAQDSANGAVLDAKQARTTSQRSISEAENSLRTSGEASKAASDAMIISRKASEEAAVLERREQRLEEATAKAEMGINEQMAANFNSFNSYLRGSGIRVLRPEKLANNLKVLPKKTVEILFKSDDTEVDLFASSVYQGLHLAGWNASMRPVKPEDRLCGRELYKEEISAVITHDLNSSGTNQPDFQTQLGMSAELGLSTAHWACSELPEDKIVLVFPTRRRE